MKKEILVVGDDSRSLRTLEETLKKDYELKSVSTLEQAVDSLKVGLPELVIIDYDLKELNGIEVFKKLRQVSPKLKAIMISGSGSISAAVTATKLGVSDFLSKPLLPERLRESIDKALIPEEEVPHISWVGVEDSEWLQGVSNSLEQLFKELEKVIKSQADVLIIGEKGIPKKPIAEILHKNGLNRRRKLVTLDLLSFHRESAESHFWTTLQELLQERVGTMQPQEELCGTLYLLEGFETINPHFQESILKFLKGRKEKGGIDRGIRVAIGITDKAKLLELESKGQLTTFLRLNLPSLRDRKEDVPLLIQAYLKKFARELGKNIREISTEALSKLMIYDWPGNIQELKILIQNAALKASSTCLTLRDLPLDLKMIKDESLKKIFRGETLRLEGAKRSFEKEFLNIVLEKVDWDEEKASDFLDIPKTVLSSRLQSLGIVKPTS